MNASAERNLGANDLHLVFLPAEHALLDQHLVGGGGVQAAFHDAEELLAVIGDAAAGAAHGEGRADDQREADPGEQADHGDGEGLKDEQRSRTGEAARSVLRSRET